MLYYPESMDFLDPKKERRNRVALRVGYALVGFAIAIASTVLLYQTDGYCVSGKGAVDRCGLLFVSTHPTGADMYVDGKKQKAQTNTKLNLRSGTYDIRLTKTGYHDWQRPVTIAGGDVQRMDYPLLVPQNLTTSSVATLSETVNLMTQSPDRRWLLAIEGSPSEQYHLYDLRPTTKPIGTVLTVPAGVVTASEGVGTWKTVEWSNDNRHVLLQHEYKPVALPAASSTPASDTQATTEQEYILFDRQTPAETKNLTRDLALSAQEQISLYNKKPTQFYAYNTESKTLRTLGLSTGAPTQNQLTHVLAYKTYGNGTVLYVTDTPPSGKTTDGKVHVVLLQENQTRVLRQLPADPAGYLLDIARYDGEWYVYLGASSQRGLYIYKNPLEQALMKSTDFPVPMRFLKLASPQYAAFSSTAQYVLVENGQQCMVYDIEHDQSYGYATAMGLDEPQTHVSWMDGNRLAYVSGGKVYVVDYDNLNGRTLVETDARWGGFFTPDYERLITLSSLSGEGSRLSTTSIVVVP